MSTGKRRIITIVGARPQFIKAAPLSRALAAVGLEERIVHTGQHFDAAMSDIFFKELAISGPAHNLEINSVSHGAMTGRMLEGIERILIDERPEMVIVIGDTNSTLAGALAAAKLQIPIAHIEAGLRSYNQRMPEEINRIMTDHLSTLLFCPTQTSITNLKREGINKGVMAAGDVMYDATLHATGRSETESRILETLELTPKSYAVATIHRAENTDDQQRFVEIFAWLVRQSKIRPVILPLHPRTSNLLKARNTDTTGLRLLPPLGYLDMVRLLHHAAMIYTDSGGVQKEAYFHRVPCVTLRDETEWAETITFGWNRLWREPEFNPRQEITDYGTGNSSEIIAAAIRDWLAKSAKDT